MLYVDIWFKFILFIFVYKFNAHKFKRVMKTKTVYRVEHTVSRLGIFHHFYNLDTFTFAEELRTLHRQYKSPGADADKVLQYDYQGKGIVRERVRNVAYMRYDHLVCAFNDIKSFNKYIPKQWRDELKELGFEFYKIKLNNESENCVILRQQTLFNDSAVIKKEILK